MRDWQRKQAASGRAATPTALPCMPALLQTCPWQIACAASLSPTASPPRCPGCFKYETLNLSMLPRAGLLTALHCPLPLPSWPWQLACTLDFASYSFTRHLHLTNVVVAHEDTGTRQNTNLALLLWKPQVQAHFSPQTMLAFSWAARLCSPSGLTDCVLCCADDAGVLRSLPGHHAQACAAAGSLPEASSRHSADISTSKRSHAPHLTLRRRCWRTMQPAWPPRTSSSAC